MNKTNIKMWIGVVLIATMAATVVSCDSTTASKKKRPNIIYIMSDDHATHAISAYGGIYDDYLQTPNIDRIANEGIKFNNVFCTNAICGPSRAAILTGKYSHENGYYKNESGGKFDSTQWTFPRAMQTNGYKTALVGKWHLGTEPVGFDYFKYHDNPGQQGFYYNPIYNDNGTKVKEEGYATTLTTNYALDWLEKEKENDQPFLLMLQYKAPHRNWYPEKKYEHLYDSVEMPYPATFYDDYQGRELTAGDTDMTMDFFNRKDMKLTPPEGLTQKEQGKWLGWGNRRGMGEGWMPSDTMTVEQARKWKYQRYIKDYLACVKSVDDGIGRVLDYLDEQGLAENTIVVYTSDQGFYLGDHGFFDKRFMYEPSLRMPFVLRYPAAIKKHQENNDMITNVDFAPTILDFAGLEIPADVQGRSFVANTMGKKPKDWPTSMYYHYYEFPFWHHVQPHYGLRGERYKLIHFYYNVDQWEFYDLEKDPDEMNNAIDDPAYADIIAKMKEDLKKSQELYKDNGSLNEFRAITDADFGQISGSH
ncbi:sulfatase [Reichenbachiella carrageenanivorans]|uniref:Sulfatase n=1 Tax=Reichenbachiella carrageenanivorans TaxID=2979869 RepID=A0ABY6D0X3_9BACT|nr:sulfatase [Reichenbachiella carrageenanivorans]UXX79829.1 sulfatase [Reichenbachiella carrageenanivorans]